jgi:dihydroorotase
MAAPLWLRRVSLLTGPHDEPQPGDALIAADGALVQWGGDLREQAAQLGVSATEADGWLLAPALVDPHSALDDPWGMQRENLSTLAAAAAAGGYGAVALLPWGRPWRDRPEALRALQWPEPLKLHLWGSFSEAGDDRELAAHLEQLEAGAIGLAGTDELPPLPLLEKGLLLGDMGERPVLVAPRRADLTGGGFMREGVETLRAGWPPDPHLSESLPLSALLELARHRPGRRLVLMNLSTTEGVALLRKGPDAPPAATVSWWHLLADSSTLSPWNEGWRLVPSLGSPADREALIAALAEGLITAVAVHHLPLDPEEQLLPLDQRRAGLAGHGPAHGLVLPLLWSELVRRRGWTIRQLWRVLSFGAAELIGLPPPRLQPGSKQWLLFDPSASWVCRRAEGHSLAANLPLQEGQSIEGMVRATGLSAPHRWRLEAAGCPSD